MVNNKKKQISSRKLRVRDPKMRDRKKKKLAQSQ